MGHKERGLNTFVETLREGGTIGPNVHARLKQHIVAALAEARNEGRAEAAAPAYPRGLDSPAGAGADVEAERG